MKILVTGGAGFIGSTLSRDLLKEGHEIKVIDNLSTGRKENIADLIDLPNFQFVFGTVTDTKVMEELVSWSDHVYHLAAPVGVKYIMENPVHTILDNMRGIDVVMAQVYKHKKKVMITSTSEIYGKSLDFLDPENTRKLREDDYRIEGSTQNHRWAYANTKTLDEFLALAYFKEYGTEIVIARLFNTVGPRQLSAYGMVIPNFVERALRNKTIEVHGDGFQRRSFMHVHDVTRALKLLMSHKGAVGNVFNVGNPIEITINDLAKLIIQKTSSTSEIKHIPYEEVYGEGFEDMNRRTADISRLQQTTGFRTSLSLDDILDDIIAWQTELVKAG